MLIEMVSVEVPGPPPVMIRSWTNRLNEAIVAITITTIDTGRSWGSTMRRKRAHEPAPSIWAASMVARGTWVTPAYMMMKLKPMVAHTVARSMAIHAYGRLVSHWMFTWNSVLTEPPLVASR